VDLLTSVWVVALLTFIIGVAIGAIAHKMLYSDESRAKKLEDELSQTRHDFDIYKEMVTSHYSKTSELVKDLTEDYVKVYQHLAEGAEKLTDTSSFEARLGQQQSNKLVSIIEKPEQESAADDKAAEALQPPRDYAPKEPDAKGTLSEDFSTEQKASNN